MGLLGSSFDGLFGGGQQQQSARQAGLDRTPMEQQSQYNIATAYGLSSYGLSSSATLTLVPNIYYSADTNNPVFSQSPRTRTAVEWLDERVNEMRVAL